MKKLSFCIFALLIIQLFHCSSYIIKESITARNNAWSVTIEEYAAGPDGYYGTMNVYRGRSSTETYYPPESESGLLWMKLSVTNVSEKDRAFKFNRIRLIGDDYISTGKIVFSNMPFAEEGSIQKIKPHDAIARWVLFTYNKKSFPHKFVYDDYENNSIVDKISIDLPDRLIE